MSALRITPSTIAVLREATASFVHASDVTPQPADPFVACHIYAQSRGGPKDGPLAPGHRSCQPTACRPTCRAGPARIPRPAMTRACKR